MVCRVNQRLAGCAAKAARKARYKILRGNGPWNPLGTNGPVWQNLGLVGHVHLSVVSVPIFSRLYTPVRAILFRAPSGTSVSVPSATMASTVSRRRLLMSL